jgi:hypothetical protein
MRTMFSVCDTGIRMVLLEHFSKYCAAIGWYRSPHFEERAAYSFVSMFFHNLFSHKHFIHTQNEFSLIPTVHYLDVLLLLFHILGGEYILNNNHVSARCHYGDMQREQRKRE